MYYRNMRTFIRTLGSLAALSLLVVAFPVSAASLSTAQIEAVVALLKSFNADQELITQVQNDLVSRSNTRPTCYTFAANVSPGSTGPVVTTLQNVLRAEGLTVVVTGVYDAQTTAAVTAFQEKHASEILQPLGLARGTGLVGAATRTTLNKLYGCASGSVATKVAASSTPVRFELSGPVHGQLDYNNDARADQADVQFLLDVAVGAQMCPGSKLCDLDKDGRIVASDALVLANYIGSVAKPGKLDFNNDLKLDASDARELERILNSGAACPASKVCDASGDALFNGTDTSLLFDYVGR
jgi:Dockerin type I domain/Putative peptidoglycan binding domain